jgi:hypothetical protein
VADTLDHQGEVAESVSRDSKLRVRVIVELEGEPEEIGLVLSQLGETLAVANVGELEVGEMDEVESRMWWTPQRAAAFVRELTPPALQALSVIASHPPRLSFREFQRRMGMSGPQLAGRLSSIGFTVARQGTPFPFVRDYYQKVYLIDDEVAAVLHDAADAETARRHDEARQSSSHKGA